MGASPNERRSKRKDIKKFYNQRCANVYGRLEFVAMKKIKKSAEVAAEEGTHQLTGIEVHEVSVVDRAANMRRFITRKSETPAETAARVQAKIAERGGNGPGAELDAVDPIVASVTEKAKDVADVADVADGGDLSTVHAHAASAHAAAATAHAAAAEGVSGKKAKKSGVAPLPPPAGASTETVVAPSSAAVTDEDPEAELLALAKSADITVAANPDGSVAITVDENAPILLNPSLPGSVTDKVKASVIAGIDAIMLRIATLRQNVVGSDGSYGASGSPSALNDIWYITDMLYALYSIGGPSWEIEQAGDAVEKSADGTPVRKNKLISATRVAKLKLAHVAMKYAHGDMENVFKELDCEGGDATGEMASQTTATNGAPTNFAKAATVDAPAKDIKEDPAFIALAAELERSKAELTKSKQGAEALQKIVANQGDIIAKARGTVAPSNVSGESSPTPIVAEVEWPRDLAAPTVPLSKNFGRDDQRARR